MPDPETIAQILKQYGPLGAAIVLMAFGIIYTLRWLQREQHAATNERHLERLAREASLREFLTQINTKNEQHGREINEQHERHAKTIEAVTDKFTASLERFGMRLETRIESLEDEVRQLHRKE